MYRCKENIWFCGFALEIGCQKKIPSSIPVCDITCHFWLLWQVEYRFESLRDLTTHA